MTKRLPLLLLFTLAIQTIFAQSPTNPALNFNVFVQYDSKLSSNETEGPFATGRDLTIAGNYQVSTNQVGTFTVNNKPTTLVIGNQLKFQSGNALQVNQNGMVKIGDGTGIRVWYTDQNNAYSPIRITKNNNYNSTPFLLMQANAQQLGTSATNNPIVQGNLIDFGAAFNTMKNNALNMAACADNATITNANGQVLTSRTSLPSQIKINLNAGQNTLNLSGAVLNSVSNFTYNQQPSASQYLVINVDANGTFNWNVWNQAGIGQTQAKYIIYNFYNATKININGNSTIEGTIFAPYAEIVKSTNQSNIEGQVICQHFTQTSGEVHYAPFLPSVPGCAAVTPTVAAFSIVSQDNCLASNFFNFNNNSTGQGAITSSWNFGDGNTSTAASPTHIYAAPGTYTVSLTVTSASGTNSTTTSVTVYPMPVSTFSINDSSQSLTNNAFVFSPVGNIANTTFNWDFGDGTIANNSPNAAHTYTQTGAFLVRMMATTTNGCSSTFQWWISVENDTCGTGNDGGLESKSLEGAISYRNFYLRSKDLYQPFNAATAPKFKLSTQAKSGTPFSLDSYIPTSYLPGDAAINSSPQFLTLYTNATEAIAVDYVLNGATKGSILATSSIGQRYSHTKYTCDRFKSGDLKFLQTAQLIGGFEAILFGMQQPNGNTEYGIELVFGKMTNRPEISLQSQWLTTAYANEDTMFTYQLWTTSVTGTVDLANKMLANVQGLATLIQPSMPQLPAVFVSKATRNNNLLNLDIINTTTDPMLGMTWCQKNNELAAAFDTTNGQYLSTEMSSSTMIVDVADNYEFDIYFSLNGTPQEKIYVADANWGLDYVATNTTIDKFEISNDVTRNYATNEHAIMRDVALQGNTNDYISIFKDLKGGGLTVDLTGKTGLEFYGKGAGLLEIRLVNASIANWRSQFKTTIELTAEGSWFAVPFTSFFSDSIAGAISPADLNTVVFTFVPAQAGFQNFDIELKHLAFVENFEYSSVKEKATTTAAVAIYPNPNYGRFVVATENSEATTSLFTLVDLAGRTQYTQFISTAAGHQEQWIDVSQAGLAKGIYIGSLKTASGTQSFKIVIE